MWGRHIPNRPNHVKGWGKQTKPNQTPEHDTKKVYDTRKAYFDWIGEDSKDDIEDTLDIFMESRRRNS
jgi:hypothetical protein